MSARRRFMRTMSGRRKKRSGKMTVAKVKRIVQNVTEPKYVDTSIDFSTFFLGTSEVAYLCDVDAGDSNVERSGRRIKVQSVQMKGTLTTPAAAVSDVHVRILLVCKKECDGSTIEITRLLTNANPRVIDLRAFDTMNEYRVIWDKSMVIKQTTLNGVNNISKRSFNKYKRFKRPLLVTYNADTGPVAQCVLNGLFLLVMSDHALDLQSPNLLAQVRLVFKD